MLLTNEVINLIYDNGLDRFLVKNVLNMEDKLVSDILRKSTKDFFGIMAKLRRHLCPAEYAKTALGVDLISGDHGFKKLIPEGNYYSGVDTIGRRFEYMNFSFRMKYYIVEVLKENGKVIHEKYYLKDNDYPCYLIDTILTEDSFINHIRFDSGDLRYSRHTTPDPIFIRRWDNTIITSNTVTLVPLIGTWNNPPENIKLYTPTGIKIGNGLIPEDKFRYPRRRNIYEYDSENRILKQVNDSNAYVEYEYSGDKLSVVRFSDKVNGSLPVDANNNLISLNNSFQYDTQPEANEINLVYDAQGKLIEMVITGVGSYHLTRTYAKTTVTFNELNSNTTTEVFKLNKL